MDIFIYIFASIGMIAVFLLALTLGVSVFNEIPARIERLEYRVKALEID